MSDILQCVDNQQHPCSGPYFGHFLGIYIYIYIYIIYICSTQSENLRDLQIALRNLRILRTEANLQIACVICRLRNNAI